MKKRKIGLFKTWFFTGLSAFTLYMALDTFVIPRKISASGIATSSAAQLLGSTSSDSSQTVAGLSSTATITDSSYSDENIKITITEYRENDTSIYVADVVVTSPKYLQTALAQGVFGKNITATTSDIADSVNAILSINGDYYGARESGYVIRDGVLYREESAGDQEDLVIYQDGSFEIINESDISAKELLEKGAWQVLSFGPGLVEDGEISVGVGDEVGKAMVDNPRTAIGIIDTNHYVLVVSDGRTSESSGLTLYQLAEFMKGLGVKQAYNLDGGGSSTMVFNGKVINNPTTNGNTISERKVSDMVYIGY